MNQKPLDFCMKVRIIRVGNAIRPISMGFHAKTKPPRSCRSKGVFHLLVLAVLVLTVKPLADAVGNYTRCDG